MKSRIKRKIDTRSFSKDQFIPKPMIVEKEFIEPKFPKLIFKCGHTLKGYGRFGIADDSTPWNPKITIYKRHRLFFKKPIMKIRKKRKEYVITIWDNEYTQMAEQIQFILEGMT